MRGWKRCCGPTARPARIAAPTDRIYAFHGKAHRIGLKKCGHCRKQFTVKVGTVFEQSHVPLHKWLQAVHLLCSSKKGISSHQLHRILEVTYKTAWFMSHRIREAMRDGTLAPLGGTGTTRCRRPDLRSKTNLNSSNRA